MDWDTFREKIQQDGRYSSAADGGEPAVFAGRFDAYFYQGLASVVWHCSARARRGELDSYWWGYWSMEMIRLIERCGGQVEIDMPATEMQAGKPFVVAANHMSLLETTILPAVLLPLGPLAVVVKDSLLEYPVFRHTMRATRPISVGRKDPRSDLKTVLQDGSAALQEGRNVLIFPQATRDAVFRPAVFNSLGAKLAERNKRPLVPMALKTDFMGLGRIFKDIGRLDRSQTVRLSCSAPLPPEQGHRAVHAAAKAGISAMLGEWGVQIEKEAQ